MQLIENGRPTLLGVTVGVVALAITAYTVKKLVFDKGDGDLLAEANEALEGQKEISKKLNDMNTSLELENKAVKAEARVALAEAKVIGLDFAHERKLLNDQRENLSKQEQELAHERKALQNMEKRLKLEVSKA